MTHWFWGAKDENGGAARSALTARQRPAAASDAVGKVSPILWRAALATRSG